MEKEKILIADDDKNIQYAFKKAFVDKNIDIITASDGFEAIEKIHSEKPDLIFLDITMPNKGGLEVLQEVNAKKINIPVVIITGYGTMNNAIKAVHLGAYEYLQKPLDVDKIYLVAKRAFELTSLKNKIDDLNAQLTEPSKENEIIGSHSSMQEVYKKIGAVSSKQNITNILITGESGTGKELVARAIHKNSKNSNKPFIAISCTVLPENLQESELFGHEKGSFTGAVDQKMGKFEAAGEGTIFLDEIGDMSHDLQKKLLRVLQEREFYRVGGNKLIKVKARVITATNRDLLEEIKKENFREDLYFRLNVVHITNPPLRERKSDIPALFYHFVRKYSQKLDKKIKVIAPEIMDLLHSYDFPGNVRELENMAERAVIMSHGEVMTQNNLKELINPDKITANFKFSTFVLEDARSIFNLAFEKEYINELMSASGGNISKAAELACVDRRTIHRLIKKYNLNTRKYKV